MSFQGHHVFFSYSRQDDALKDVTGSGWVERFHDHLKAYHKRKTGQDLAIFFDRNDIDNGELWKQRLMAGIRSSRLFLAFLSPNYVRSPNCRWEWNEYVRREHMLARGADGILNIYFQPVPGMPGGEDDPELQRIEAELLAEGLVNDWLKEVGEDLQRRQSYLDPVDAGRQLRAGFDLRSWFRHGPQALAELDAAERLADLRDHPRAQELDLITLNERIAIIHERIAKRFDRCLLAEMAPGHIGRSYTHFVGRYKELAAIHEALLSGAGLITAVHGMGGLGKTALAVQYAHAYAEHYAAGGRWLIDCEGETSLPHVIRKLSRSLHMDERELPLGDDEAAVEIMRHLKKLTLENGEQVLHKLGQQEGRLSTTPTLPKEWKPRALLVFDNVDRAELFSAAQTALLPAEEWLEYIVTTRLPSERFGAGERQLKAVPVDSLPIPDAVALIRDFYPGRAFPSTAHAQGVEDLARALGGFTLAVEMAGAYLGLHPEIAPAAYLQQLEQRGLQRVDELMKGRVAEEVRYEKEDLQQRQVRYIIESSLAQLEEAYKDELPDLGAVRTLLDAASCLPPDAIAMPWLMEVVVAAHPSYNRTTEAEPDPWLTLWQAVYGMRFLNAFDEESDGGVAQSVPLRARMHRVIGSTWQALAGKEHMERAFTDLVEKLLEFATTVEAIKDTDPHLASLVRYDLALTGLHLLERDEDNHTLAACLVIAATLEFHHGKRSRSGWWFERAHQVFARRAKADPNEGNQHALSVSLERLGDFYQDRSREGDAERALQCIEECFAIRRATLASDPDSLPAAVNVATSTSQLGECYIARGSADDERRAVECFEQSLDLNQSILVRDPGSKKAARRVLVSLQRLAKALLDLAPDNATERALSLLERSLEIGEELLRNDPKSAQAKRDVSMALDFLGQLHLERDGPSDTDRAITIMERALELREELLSYDPASVLAARDVGALLNNLANAHRKRGPTPDREREGAYLARSLQIHLDLFKADPGSTQAAITLSTSFHRLGLFHDERAGVGDFERAVTCREHSLEISQGLLSLNPTSKRAMDDVKNKLELLGDLFMKRGQEGDMEPALTYYSSALKVMRQRSVPDPGIKDATQLFQLHIKLYVVQERLQDVGQANIHLGLCHMLLHALHLSEANMDEQMQNLYAQLNAKYGLPTPYPMRRGS